MDPFTSYIELPQSDLVKRGAILESSNENTVPHVVVIDGKCTFYKGLFDVKKNEDGLSFFSSNMMVAESLSNKCIIEHSLLRTPIGHERKFLVVEISVFSFCNATINSGPYRGDNLSKHLGMFLDPVEYDPPFEKLGKTHALVGPLPLPTDLRKKMKHFRDTLVSIAKESKG